MCNWNSKGVIRRVWFSGHWLVCIVGFQGGRGTSDGEDVVYNGRLGHSAPLETYDLQQTASEITDEEK